jgi:hypothetical protein
VSIPDPPTPKRGGPDFHKPGCRCNACAARRRKAEAELNGAGLPAPVESASEETILVDTPTHHRGIEKQRIKMWLQWKAMEPKLTHEEAAKRLGLATQTLTNLIYKATKQGWLKFTNPLDELEYEIMPKVTHNLKYYLDQGDKDVTIKTAQGTLFKQFQAAKGIQQVAPQTTVLAFKIEMPSGGPSHSAGVIVGAPRKLEIIDAEVVKPEPNS